MTFYVISNVEKKEEREKLAAQRKKEEEHINVPERLCLHKVVNLAIGERP
jgi:hypothetical protein